VVVIYPEGVWYRVEEIERDVDEIVERHIVKGEHVERLKLRDRPARTA
jgi:(2Fe-2S) ferredoxin